uniref:hypothetical protein n=1 Tax=Delftia tsuruhatensis TaxID=180282 RepID=UPI0020291690|nr:hypothetical protein [Delftia tsuruhatensis]
MKKEHKYAQALRWLADGEILQVQLSGDPDWCLLEDLSEAAHSEFIAGYDGFEFRIKPKTITVGDREIEAPVMIGPGYYITDHGDAFRWFGEATLDPGANLQKLGRVYATEEAARAAQEAITALLTREPS